MMDAGGALFLGIEVRRVCDNLIVFGLHKVIVRAGNRNPDVVLGTDIVEVGNLFCRTVSLKL